MTLPDIGVDPRVSARDWQVGNIRICLGIQAFWCVTKSGLLLNFNKSSPLPTPPSPQVLAIGYYLGLFKLEFSEVYSMSHIYVLMKKV
jgi:hypothetical protein